MRRPCWMTKTLCKMLICMLIGICVTIHIFVARFCFNCKVWLSLAFLCKFSLLCFGSWSRLMWTWTEPGEPVHRGPVQGSKNCLNRTLSPVRSSWNFVKNRTKPDRGITTRSRHIETASNGIQMSHKCTQDKLATKEPFVLLNRRLIPNCNNYKWSYLGVIRFRIRIQKFQIFKSIFSSLLPCLVRSEGRVRLKECVDYGDRGRTNNGAPGIRKALLGL